LGTAAKPVPKTLKMTFEIANTDDPTQRPVQTEHFSLAAEGVVDFAKQFPKCSFSQALQQSLAAVKRACGNARIGASSSRCPASSTRSSAPAGGKGDSLLGRRAQLDHRDPAVGGAPAVARPARVDLDPALIPALAFLAAQLARQHLAALALETIVARGWARRLWYQAGKRQGVCELLHAARARSIVGRTLAAGRPCTTIARPVCRAQMAARASSRSTEGE
jgi:hypothetical protein